MNHIIQASMSRDSVTMSSLELLDVVNQARLSHGETEVRRNDFASRCRDELDGDHYETFVVRNPNGTESEAIRMSKDQCMYVLMRESKAVRRSATVKLNELESRQAVTTPTKLSESLRLAADLAEKNEVLLIENQQQSIKISSLENLFKEGMTATQYCKGLNGVNVMAVNAYLFSRQWLYNESKTGTRWRVGSYARDRYMTEHQHEITPHGAEPFMQFTAVLLKKGAARLHELYLAGELPMKKTWDGLYTHDKEDRRAA